MVRSLWHESTLPNLILVLCLSLSIGMPLLKSLGFLPTMPQLNYKISALGAGVGCARAASRQKMRSTGQDDTITYDHVSFAYQTTQPGPDGKPVVIEEMKFSMTFPLRQKLDRKQPLLVNLAPARVPLAKLLIHYYDPQKGSISIGGQKLMRYEP